MAWHEKLQTSSVFTITPGHCHEANSLHLRGAPTKFGFYDEVSFPLWHFSTCLRIEIRESPSTSDTDTPVMRRGSVEAAAQTLRRLG